MKGKTSANVQSIGKKRKGKGDPEIAEQSKSEEATISLGKKERLAPCFKKKKRAEIIKEATQNKDPVVLVSNPEKCTAEENTTGTKVDERNQDVQHKDRKDILVDDVTIVHGVILPEMREKEDSDHLGKGDNLRKTREEMRMEPLQTDKKQSKQSSLIKKDNYKKSEKGTEGTDLKEGLERKENLYCNQPMKCNTSDNLSNSLEDITSCVAQNLDIVQESPLQKSVHLEHDKSKQMNQPDRKDSEHEQDIQKSIQDKFAQFNMTVSSQDNSLLKSIKQHQVVCDQNSTKHIEILGKSLSYTEKIIHSVKKCSEISSFHQSKTSSPDKYCMDTGLTETTKDTSSTNFTSDAETICFDNSNDDTSSGQKAIKYAKDKNQSTSANTEKSTDVTCQYSDKTTGITLCNVDASDGILEKVKQAEGHGITCASFEKAMQYTNTSSGTADAVYHKTTQDTSRTLDTDCAGIDKPKTDTGMNLDTADANFNMNLTDIISNNNNSNEDVNQQFSFMDTENTFCQTKDLFTQSPQLQAGSKESDEPCDAHSLQDSAKNPQIKDADSINNACIFPDEASDEMISYSPQEAIEVTVSQDPTTRYAEGIQVDAEVPEACRDECHHNTDLTDSQLCEMDWSSQGMEDEDTQKCVEKPVPRVNLQFPQQRIPDGTSIVKGLIKELSNLNKMLLRTKREIEATRRQRGTLPSQQNKYPVSSRFHK